MSHCPALDAKLGAIRFKFCIVYNSSHCNRNVDLVLTELSKRTAL